MRAKMIPQKLVFLRDIHQFWNAYFGNLNVAHV